MKSQLDVAMTALPVEEESGSGDCRFTSHPLCVLVPRSGDWLKIESVNPSCSANTRC